MKRLLILTTLSLAAAGATGCKNCCAPRAAATYRPCVPASPCAGGVETYAAPDAVIAPAPAAPTLTVPVQTYPGPEAYTPATP